jgi:hypothetical protein
MSPTSYQTAPPRVVRGILSVDGAERQAALGGVLEERASVASGHGRLLARWIGFIDDRSDRAAHLVVDFPPPPWMLVSDDPMNADLDELLAEIARLKAENERLRAELRRAARADHETPPHYL